MEFIVFATNPNADIIHVISFHSNNLGLFCFTMTDTSLFLIPCWNQSTRQIFSMKHNHGCKIRNNSVHTPKWLCIQLLLIVYLISGSLSLRYPRSIDFEPPLRKRSLKSTFQSCAFCAYIANMSRKKNKCKRAGLLFTRFSVSVISLLSLRFILD